MSEDESFLIRNQEKTKSFAFRLVSDNFFQNMKFIRFESSHTFVFEYRLDGSE